MFIARDTITVSASAADAIAQELSLRFCLACNPRAWQQIHQTLSFSSKRVSKQELNEEAACLRTYALG